MKGIDVSNNNGTVDFNSVKIDGVEAVIIKATEGVNWIDPYLEHHYEGAKEARLNIGFYHFMSERTSPTQQATDFWNAIKDKEFTVLPCLDIETNNMGRSSEEISDRCIEFINQFKTLSRLDCMIYTGAYFGRDNLDSRVKQYNGWIAHYGVDTPMETGFHVVGHQYTENGSVSGVFSDCCDVNNFSEEIFIDKIEKREEFELENLVVVPFVHIFDREVAGSLAEALKCPILDANILYDYSRIKNVYCIGCADKVPFTSYANKVFTGADRWGTAKAVKDFINNGCK